MRRYLILLTAFLVGCSYFKKQPADQEHARVDTFDSTLLDTSHLNSAAATRQFYSMNRYRFVWMDTSGPLAHGDTMIHLIRSATNYGLEPSDYHRDRIDGLLQLPRTDPQRMQLDLYLTDGFFSMHHHLKYGRVEKKSLNWIDLRKPIDEQAIAELRVGVQRNDIRERLESREPPHKQYHLLKSELRKLLSAPGSDGNTVDRIDKLKVNMERWRWIEHPLPGRYIAVNTPSFLLRVVEGDSVYLESKVIVGKKHTPTPELSSVIRSFTIYPYWHVPRSIANEILPRIQADSLYMARHNYQVLGRDGKVIDPSTLDWASFGPDNFPYTLRQREGSENSMGVIKFVFNNNYNVFLHDTNARGLFARDNRALSHGCVRVHKAVQLAHYLAKDDDTYVDPQDLDQYLEVQHRLNVNVVKPIPVLLQYFTAFADDDGVEYYGDLYEKDQDILNALYHVSLHHSEPSGPPL